MTQHTSNVRLSFEFFPPKTDAGKEKLLNTHTQLSEFNPDFFSVTYGAGGSTRDHTKDIVHTLHKSGTSTAPHLSFGGDDETAVRALLEEYKEAGINRVVALRGDRPSGLGSLKLVYANQLVSLIREHFGDHFHIEVAAYPETHPDSKTYESDIYYLKKKFEAGANSGITQYFYNSDAYYFFLERCRSVGIDQPIFPGIMPITNFTNLKRFSHNCGAELPRWMCNKIDAYGEDQDSIRQFGIDIVSRLCEALIRDGAPGLHFYTMNQVEPTRTIIQNIIGTREASHSSAEQIATAISS